MMILSRKICSTCKIEKDIDSFHKDRHRIDGHHNQCKECKKSYRPKGVITRTEKYCNGCKLTKPVAEFSTSPRTSDGCAVWCKTCIRKYYHSNPEHKRKIREASKQHRKNNPDRVKRYNKKTRLTRMEKGVRSHTTKRSENNYQQLCKMLKYCCSLCGKPGSDGDPITKDHYMPGGNDQFDDKIDNEIIIPVHRSCNQRKGKTFIPIPILQKLRLMLKQRPNEIDRVFYEFFTDNTNCGVGN